MFRKIKDYLFDKKIEKQYIKKGYCDLDVWNIDNFIETKLLEILKEFRANLHSHPYDITLEEWEQILDRMIFLLNEMNEETCSNQTKIFDSVKKYLEKVNYMIDCKNEFYDLLKKWHYYLWDYEAKLWKNLKQKRYNKN